MKRHIKLVALLIAVVFIMSVFAPSTLAEEVFNKSGSRIFTLGNDPNTIIDGGVLHKDGYAVLANSIYNNAFSNSNDTPPTVVYSDNARNLNIIDGSLFFTVYNNQMDVSEIKCINRPGEATQSEVILSKVNGRIRQMYVVNDNGSKYILYNCNDGIYRFDYCSAEPTTVVTAVIIGSFGFIPTVCGYVYYDKDASCCYSLFAQRTHSVEQIATDVMDFTIDNYDDELLGSMDIYSNEKAYTVSLSSLFGASKIVLAPKVYASQNDSVVDYQGYDSSNDEMSNSEDLMRIESRTGTTNAEDIIYQGVVPSTTQGQKNIVKRAKQLQMVKWYCKKSFSLYSDAAPFLANNYYHGVPYGQSNSIDKYVGDWTGATKLNEFVQETTTDDFYTTTNVCIADCSSFVSYAWNLPTKHTTLSLPNAANIVGGFENNSEALTTLSNLQVGDCLDTPDGTNRHCILVAALRYTEDGALKQLVTFEQRKWTGSSKRNICVYDINVAATESSYAGYKDYSHYGYAMPMSAFIMRMQQEKPTKYIAYRSKTRDTVEYTYNSNAIVGLNTPTVSLSSNGINFAKLTWSNITNAQKYEIAFSTSSDGPYSIIDIVNATSGINTYYTTLLKGYYKVRARRDETAGPNEYGIHLRSSYSSAISIDNIGDSPRNVSFQSGNANSVTINWDAPENGSGTLTYRIYASTSPNGSYSLLGSTTNRSYTHNNIQGALYYKICVYNAGTDCPPVFAAVYINNNGFGRLLGDVNGDGLINTGDATAVLNYNVNGGTFTAEQRFSSDVNFDGNINTGDSTAILRYTADLDTLPSSVTMNSILLHELTGSNNGVAETNKSYNESGDSFYIVTTAYLNGRVRCSVFMNCNITEFTSMQFEINWEAGMGNVTHTESNLNNYVIAYSNTDGMLRFAYSDYAPVANDKQPVLVFDIDTNSCTDAFCSSVSLSDDQEVFAY